MHNRSIPYSGVSNAAIGQFLFIYLAIVAFTIGLYPIVAFINAAIAFFKIYLFLKKHNFSL